MMQVDKSQENLQLLTTEVCDQLQEIIDDYTKKNIKLNEFQVFLNPMYLKNSYGEGIWIGFETEHQCDLILDYFQKYDQGTNDPKFWDDIELLEEALPEVLNKLNENGVFTPIAQSPMRVVFWIEDDEPKELFVV